jgi:branched-chain amino acid transport system substrate-binding protein
LAQAEARPEESDIQEKGGSAMASRERKGSVALLVGLLLLAGTAWGADVGVTDTEIKLGTHLALTGPAAVVGKPILDGMNLYVSYINDLGGIHGRKLVLVAEDDQFLPSRAKEAVKKLIHSDKVFAIVGSLQGAGILAALPDIEAAKVPQVFPTTALDDLFFPAKRYIIGWCISYKDQVDIQVDFAVKKLGKKKLAFINQWGPVGEVNAKAAAERAKKYGLEIAFEEKLQNVEMDYSGLVSRMRAKEVDCVVITTTAQWTVPVIKEIERQGWKPAVIISNATGNPELLAALGGSAAEGCYVTMNHLPTDADDPFIKKYREALEKYSPGAKPSMYNFLGFAEMDLLARAMTQVGKELTREKLIDTIESWKDYETDWLGKVTYSPTDHIGQERMVLVQMEGGKAKIVDPYAKPLP